MLMTHILDGRHDQSSELQMHIILEYPRVPNAQETVSSFARDPQRQGTVQMFVYNMRLTSPVFVRVWTVDARNVELCASMVSQYQQAQSMSLASYRGELQSKGLYTTVDTYSAANNQDGGMGGRLHRR
jgi:hypothetical protein